jgi:membrane associated rhomboid family serine protease
MLESEYFPIMTFFLASLMLAAFLFTTNETVKPISKNTENGCQISCPETCETYYDFYFNRNIKICVKKDMDNCICTMPKLSLYESLLGFIPAAPRIYSLITYAFIHADITHLFFNLVFLFIAGLTIEQTLGKWNFLFVFVGSSLFAAIFDILGRLLIKISFSAPFIGASGGIFGLLALTSVIKSNERIPTFLNILLLIALIVNFQPMVSWVLKTASALGSQVNLLIGSLVFIVICAILAVMPGFPSIPLVLVIFLINALVLVLSGYPTATSNVGHLGGVIGGFVSIFIFTEKKKD